MAALSAGKLAPPFRLPLLTGGEFSLQDALRQGPVLLVFFKISCPTCQYAFPFLERVFRQQEGGNLTVVGISQNNARDTQRFLHEYGVTFPVALDDPGTYAVSNAYGLTNVPTLFYITPPNGEIEISSVGWSKSEVEAMNRKLAQHQNRQPHSIFKLGESVRDFRAG